MKEQFEVDNEKGKSKAEEEIEPKPDPPLEKEPFLNALKALSGKALEGIPIFTRRMDVELVMEWIEGMERVCVGSWYAKKWQCGKSGV